VPENTRYLGPSIATAATTSKAADDRATNRIDASRPRRGRPRGRAEPLPLRLQGATTRDVLPLLLVPQRRSWREGTAACSGAPFRVVL